MSRTRFAVALFAALAFAAPPAQASPQSDTTIVLRPDSTPAPTIAHNAISFTKATVGTIANVGFNLTVGTLNFIGRAGHSTAKAVDATGCDHLPLSGSCKSYLDREIADARTRAARQRTSTSSTLKDTTSSIPDPHSRK